MQASGFRPTFTITNAIAACLTRIERARGFLDAGIRGTPYSIAACAGWSLWDADQEGDAEWWVPRSRPASPKTRTERAKQRPQPAELSMVSPELPTPRTKGTKNVKNEQCRPDPFDPPRPGYLTYWPLSTLTLSLGR